MPMAEAAVRPAPQRSPLSIPPQLYALVDLARAPQLLPLIDWLSRSGAAQCLFEGKIAEGLRRVSPHIVALARAPQLMDRWMAEGRGQSWGVFIETPLPMHLARRHVRRFLQVKLPDGSGPVLMRVWDPRVLGVLLDRVDGEQAIALFAQPLAYWCEVDGETLRRFDGGNVESVFWVALSTHRPRQAL